MEEQTPSDDLATSFPARESLFGVNAPPEPEAIESFYEAPYEYFIETPRDVQQSYTEADVGEIYAPQTKQVLEIVAERYAKQVLLDYDLQIEWERVDFRTDGRLGAGVVRSGALGKCGCSGYKHANVRVSSKYYIEQNYSWERCKETIRHELAHAWQIRWLGYSSHGPTFMQKAKELDVENIERYEGKSEPKYVAHCTACGISYTRQRNCKRVKQPYSSCSNCDAGRLHDLAEDGAIWRVWKNTDWRKVMADE
jgi:predicted SprT family Zn-dependent metalloprotease